MSDKVELKLEFKIDEIKKVSHFEKDFKEYGLKPSDITDGKMNLNLGVGFDQKNEIAIFSVKIKCHSKDGKYLLFGIESIFKYYIKGLNENFRNEEIQSYQLPKPLMGVLVGTAISGTRGMMAALNTTPEYQKIYLPIVPTEKLIEDMGNKELK
jgi:hypothetical protein